MNQTRKRMEQIIKECDNLIISKLTNEHATEEIRTKSI